MGVTFFVGGLCFVLLQVIWCCRQNKISLYVSAGISTLAAVLCTIAGIVMLVGWKDKVQCNVWRLTGDDDFAIYYPDDDLADYPNNPSDDDPDDDYASDHDRRDFCEEDIWATVAFITAALWFATTGCILYFVKKIFGPQLHSLLLHYGLQQQDASCIL